MTPRYYQSDAVKSVLDYFESGASGHPLIVAPTGSGKSLMIALLIQQILAQYPTARVMCLTHVKELLQQNAEKLRNAWPDAPMGIYSAGLRQSNTEAPIIFAGIQSVWNKAKALSSEERPIELVFIDEAHRVPLHPQGTYRRFIGDLIALNPHLRLIGLTATPYRHIPGTKTHSGGYQFLTIGEDRLFTDIVFDITKDLVRLIREDYLAALWPQPTKYLVNLNQVRIENGDYKAHDLNELMEQDEVVDSILTEAIHLARIDDRKHWLVFCAGVAAAHKTGAELNARGISAEVITGETSSRDREQSIRAFRTGQITALVSVGVLTTGFDAPVTDCLILARPTLSPVLYVQMLGRGMRPTEAKIAMVETDGAPLKRGCLVLDFCGNVDRHGSIDRLRLKPPGLKKPQPMKNCPECEAAVPISAMICPDCGHEFEANTDQKTEAPKSGDSAIIAGITPRRPPVYYPIARVNYSRHIGKTSGKPTLRVDYFSGFLRVASEWVCLEHDGYARIKAERWWKQRCSEYLAPTVIDEDLLDALNDGLLKPPVAISVLPENGKQKFPEIVRYEWVESPPCDL